ncbi:DNA polymerase IV [Haliscomenobacter sp.]|uniref:DNA polymerase IV n=1 Tax=Haliscomenobacter sp. TaxID=2717303 RepID=UPI003BA97416
MFDRAVLHLDADTFFVSVERKRNSALKDKPIVIGGGSDRGVVSSCSYEARKYGVCSGMAMKMAQRLCPEAIYLRGDMDAYTQESQLITDIISEYAPVFAKNSIDDFEVDLSGLDRYFGAFKWSGELRQRIMRESGLPISAGVSVNRFVSKMASNAAKPCGELLIDQGQERPFLSPLQIAKMHGVGEVYARKLVYMGIRKIGTLSQIPPKLLVREFGKYGTTLWEHSNGIDSSRVIPYHEEKSLSKECTFQTDTIDLRFLKAQLTDLCSTLAFNLRASGKLASCVAVKIRYTDFQTYHKQKQIPYTSSDQTLLDCTLDLFDRLYTRRQLVRLIGVRFSGLVRGNLQISLLEDTPQEIELLQALDRVRRRFGQHAIKWASAL